MFDESQKYFIIMNECFSFDSHSPKELKISVMKYESGGIKSTTSFEMDSEGFAK